jgi:hypothetical protein
MAATYTPMAPGGFANTSSTSGPLTTMSYMGTTPSKPNGLLGKLQEYPVVQELLLFSRAHLQHVRPWSDFFDRNRISRPAHMNAAIARISHNVQQFRANYMMIALVLVIYILITNLWLLFSVVFVGIGVRWLSSKPADQPIMLGGRMFSQKELYAALIVVALILMYVSAAGSAIFWVIGASGAVIFTHAALLEKSLETEFSQGQGQV